MSLVVLLFMSMAVPLMVSLKESKELAHQEFARQEARYGLMRALGQLQELAGPDRRVTAMAPISYDEDVHVPQWTGVWQSALGTEAHGTRLGWLVSEGNEHPLALDPLEVMTVSGKAANASVAVLLGPGTIAAEGVSGEARYEWIGLAKKAHGNARYAYWVGDEGVKARVNGRRLPVELEARKGLCGLEALADWAGLGGFNMEVFGEMLSPEQEGWTCSHEGLLDWGSVGAVGSKVPQERSGLFHALSYHGRAVITNVAEGGLKRDLTAGLGDSETFERELAEKALYDVAGLSGYSAVSAYAPMSKGPLWEVVRDYYKSYEWIYLQDGLLSVNARASRAQDAGLLVPVGSAAAGGWHHPHDVANSALLSVAASARPATMELMPVVRRYQVMYYLSAARIDNGPDGVEDETTSADDAYCAVLGIQPFVVLHNPYNVWLRNVKIRLSLPLNHRLSLAATRKSGSVWEDLPAPGVTGRKGSPLEDSSWQHSLLADALAWGVSAEDWEEVESKASVAWTIETDMPPGAVLHYSLDGVVDLGKEDEPEQGEGGVLAEVALVNREFREDFMLRYYRLERTGAEIPESKTETSWDYWPMRYDASVNPVAYGRATDRLRATLGFDTAEYRTGAGAVPGLSTFCIEDLNTTNADGVPYCARENAIPILQSAIEVQSSDLKRFWDLARESQPIGNFLFQSKTSEPVSFAIMDWMTEECSEDVVLPILGAHSGRGLMPDAQAALASRPHAYATFLNAQAGNGLGEGLNDWMLNSEEEGLELAYWGGDVYTLFSNGNVGASTRVCLFELPAYPLFSLGQLQHAPVQTSEAQAAYLIGNSIRPPEVVWGVPDETDGLFQVVEGTHPVESLQREVLVDASYALNDKLFDRYFFSTVPLPKREGSVAIAITAGMPDFSACDSLDFGRHYLGGDEVPYNVFNSETIAAKRPLPCVQYAYCTNAAGSPVPGDYSDEVPNALRGFRTAAANLVVEGGFNVNCIEPEAWAALFSAWRVGGQWTADGLIRAFEDEAGLPGRFQIGGAMLPDSSKVDWNVARSLGDDELWALAEAMVAEVRRRGPFLSMGEFVNRMRANAAGSGADTRLAGALQAAIDAAGLNDGIEPHAAFAPGYVSQADLLSLLAPIANVRSDTFLIRAYGERVDPLTGESLSEAWCEAIVQRFPEPVNWDGSVDGIANDPGGFGRRFRILSFRWLNPEDI